MVKKRIERTKKGMFTKMKNNNEEKIIEVLHHLRPFLINDGGDLEFIKYEDHIVYIKMSGACANCMMLDVTLKDGIEAMIKDEVPEVEAVINIE